MNSIFFGNILVHVALMATFLTIFFFTFASNLEAGIVKDQVNFVIDDIIGDSFSFVPGKEQRKILIDYIVSKLPDKKDLKSADQKVEKNNKETFDTSIRFLTVLLTTVIVILILLGVFFNWNYENIKFITISGLIGLIFVAIAEFIFLILIAKNFISADPNLIRSEVVKKIVCNSNSKILL